MDDFTSETFKTNYITYNDYLHHFVLKNIYYLSLGVFNYYLHKKYTM